MNHANLYSGWIWTGEGEPFPGTVHVHDGRVAQVSEGDAPRDRLIVPGFVNAHCHLDLSIDPGASEISSRFTDWLLSVRDRRIDLGEEGMARAARDGVRRAIASGTTTIVDHDFSKLASAAVDGSAIRRVLLREVISFDVLEPERIVALEEYLDTEQTDHGVHGVAPHAPYTVHPDVIALLVRESRKRGVPCSIHVAEQPFENEFLRRGTGDYADFFEQVGVDVSRFPRPGRGTVEYLAVQGWLQPHCLLVHCNYLTPSDIELIAKHRASVVFCPRSHRWFKHPRHPLPELLQAGVNVALGTDGMISNGKLSMIEEMRAVHLAFPELDAPTIFRLATANGHQAIGHRFGSGRLSRGEPADFVELRLESDVPVNVLESTLDTETTVSRVVIAGEDARVLL